MKISNIEFIRLDMPLAVPYTIAYETVSETTNIIAKITTDTGLTAWGCAAPDREVTGETPEQVLESCHKIIEPMLKGEDPFQVARFNYLFKQEIPGLSSTAAMIDIALHDLLARRSRLPLYRLLGGFRESITTSITIGILPLKETLEQASEYLDRGFSVLKLKGGVSLGEDVEKIRVLRERLGNDFLLRFDANQGYTAQESISFIEQTADYRIEILEQPTPREKDERLGEVTRGVDVPVMADESIKTLKDAFRLASNDLIDMVNIKIQKVGGIMESMHINSVAKAAGMEVMVGCIDECALGISAGLHFALSRRNIEYADLDGHLDLLEDPFTRLFTLKNGVMYPTAHSGLGRVRI